MKKFLFIFFLLTANFSLFAQITDPVSWSSGQKVTSGNSLELLFNATIDAPWHMYATELPENGPIPTSIVFEKLEGAELSGKLTANKAAKEMYDQGMKMTLGYYEHDVQLKQLLKLTNKDNYNISGYVEYMVCNDETCLAPAKEYFEFSAQAKTVQATQAAEQPVAVPIVTIAPLQIGNADSANTAVVPVNPQTDVVNEPSGGVISQYWQPVIEQMQDTDISNKEKGFFWWIIFIKGFIGGLIAIFTPCVWPIIPMTVSFFLKRTKDKAKGKRDAILYGASIIVIYVLLGIIITLLFGANALNSLSTSAVFNLLFFALLVVFAASFLGAFEITLPASWTTKLDQKADSTHGIISIFLMAFTLVLVSFSCTGPIIGTLLVDVSVSGSILSPAIGMLGFAVALAIPFTLFALFPTWLQAMPKSGGWLNAVKVTLGFLELAFALKFLSVADLAYGWGILDREVFLVLWIVIFFMLGFYLIGKLRFVHDSEVQSISVHRLMLSIASFAFAIYMIPGLWGAPLKAISAFAPPLYTQDFNLYKDGVEAEFHDYDEAMTYAAKVKKPVIVDFSGYGCVNCRNMENSVWIKPEVKRLITEEFVLITLYVDDKQPLDEPFEIEENGKKFKIKTLGDKWSYLQRHKFGANAQPYYALLDNDGNPLSKPFFFSKDPQKFLNFLNGGLGKYENN